MARNDEENGLKPIDEERRGKRRISRQLAGCGF